MGKIESSMAYWMHFHAAVMRLIEQQGLCTNWVIHGADLDDLFATYNMGGEI